MPSMRRDQISRWPGHWKPQSPRNFFFHKLDKIYDQLLNANKVLKKTGCLRSSLYTMSTNEG